MDSSITTLSDDSVALACRALAHTTLNEQQLDVLKTMALDKQNAEIAVLVLLNSGFEYTLKMPSSESILTVKT